MKLNKHAVSDKEIKRKKLSAMNNYRRLFFNQLTNSNNQSNPATGSQEEDRKLSMSSAMSDGLDGFDDPN